MESDFLEKLLAKEIEPQLKESLKHTISSRFTFVSVVMLLLHENSDAPKKIMDSVIAHTKKELVDSQWSILGSEALESIVEELHREYLEAFSELPEIDKL